MQAAGDRSRGVAAGIDRYPGQFWLAVNDAVDGSSAVISALGHAKGGPDDMLARAASNLIAATRMHQVDRLVVLSSAAVKDPQDEPSLFCRLAPVVMPAIVNDHQAQARLLEHSGLA